MKGITDGLENLRYFELIMLILSKSRLQQVKYYYFLNNRFYLLWVVQFGSINELIDYHRVNSVSRTQQLQLRDAVAETSLQKVQSIHDFQPQEPGEIGFSRGDEILVLDQSDANWWRGRTLRDDNFNIGIFPSNYVSTT